MTHRRPINRNPLGVRKLDVQKQRREARKAAWARTAHLLKWDFVHQSEFERALKCAYDSGWEDGVTVGSQAQLDRLREALERGTLLKP